VEELSAGRVSCNQWSPCPLVKQSSLRLWRLAKEILWLHNLLWELGYLVKGPSALSIDNQGAVLVTKNPEHHGRMKHLDLQFYWLRDAVD
jgi:hypothetical protein